MSLAKQAFDKANKTSNQSAAILLYLQSIAASLIELNHPSNSNPKDKA